jgi:hypothetical protein
VHRQKLSLLVIVLAGGIAVLASYAQAFFASPEQLAKLWGGVPASWLPAYTATMLLAALGFFAFTCLVFFRIDPETVRIAGRFGYSLFHFLYLTILIPSALWTPLTSFMLESPNAGLWLAIRLVLALVGLSTLGLLAALLTLQPRPPRWVYGLALLGCVFFCLQTAVLDALVWVAYFPKEF